MIIIPRTAVRISIAFFFQAEDGIRARTVTGVQTCALPISAGSRQCARYRFVARRAVGELLPRGADGPAPLTRRTSVCAWPLRSEERRVGKSVELGGRSVVKKKIRRTVA